MKTKIYLLILILFGRPGAGKETVFKKLIELGFPIEIIVMSDVFREALSNPNIGTVVKDQIRNYIARGELVPDEIAIPIFIETLEKRRVEGKFVILVLDGVFRTKKQADAYLPRLKAMTHCRLVAMDIVVSMKGCFSRMLGRKRPGETRPVILNRLRVDYERTVPCKQAVKASGVEFLEIDGNPSLQEVVQSVKDKLDCLMKEAS